MFERYTDQARRVVAYAQQHARELGRRDVGTGPLLLGLLDEPDGAAAIVLSSSGVTAPRLLSRLESLRRGTTSPAGYLPFSPRAHRCLGLAWQEARRHGRELVDTEHILLALVRDGAGGACLLLSELGIHLGHLIEQVDAFAGQEEVLPSLPVGAPELDEVSDALLLALYHARRAARSLGQRYVDPEHLLLGLEGTPVSVAADILRHARVDSEALKAAAAAAVAGRAGDPRPRLALGPAAREATEAALHLAISRGGLPVQTVHVLAALIDTVPGIGATLMSAGAEPDGIRAAVEARLEEEDP